VPWVTFRLPDGGLATAAPGDLVGRSFTAAVRIHDGRLSEAHALVSLRKRDLMLLALRGRLRVDGRDTSGFALAEGQRVTLARGVDLVVERVHLPPAVLGVVLERAGDHGPRVDAPQVLPSVCSVVLAPAPHLAEGVNPAASALIFTDGLTWFVKRGDDEPTRVRADDVVTLGDTSLRFVAVDRVGLAIATTQGAVSNAPRLKLISRFDSLEVWVDGALALHLGGMAAQLVAELIAFAGPVRWDLLARALWSASEDDAVLRHRLDVALFKLRRRLTAAGVRPDLIRAHGTGHLELVLLPGDAVEDLG
jgi:hypothetical protein